MLNILICEGPTMKINKILDNQSYPLEDSGFRKDCQQVLDQTGVLVMPQFISRAAIDAIAAEGVENRSHVYAKTEKHTVFLSPIDPQYESDHPRNRLVTSSKGCITDDIVPQNSPLRLLYNSEIFQEFLCAVLGEEALFEYADPLSSINLHYAEKGQELGWHFDNSSFAITLMIQPPEKGSTFEFVKNVRDADAGDMNFDFVGKVLDGQTDVEQLTMDAGTLVLFRGRNSIHRVTPNLGDRTRMLAVLAYNSKPGISLSEEARRTFYGRIDVA